MGTLLRACLGPLYMKHIGEGVLGWKVKWTDLPEAAGSTTPIGVGARWESSTNNDVGSRAGVGAGVGRVISDSAEEFSICRNVSGFTITRNTYIRPNISSIRSQIMLPFS